MRHTTYYSRGQLIGCIHLRCPTFTQVGTEGDHDNNNNHQGTTLTTSGSSTPNQNISNNNAPIPGTDRRLHPTIHCYKCNQLGHYASSCPTLTNDNREMGHTNLTIGTNRISEFSFSQVEDETVRSPKMWILLNNQSTIDVFCNGDLLANYAWWRTHLILDPMVEPHQ